MKKMKNFLTLTVALTMISGQLKAQNGCDSDCDAYFESGKASYMAALLPIGALVVAAVIIATTDNRHHHSSSSSSHKSSSSKCSKSSKNGYYSGSSSGCRK
jgi:hypothetical protein